MAELAGRDDRLLPRQGRLDAHRRDRRRVRDRDRHRRRATSRSRSAPPWAAGWPGATASRSCSSATAPVQTGAFHESLNIAALWGLPVVLVCENNGYAEFTPLSAHTSVRAPRRARARRTGSRRVTLDGNDVLAVREAVTEAVARARAGEGPTFVEALTYRLRGHYEGDPASTASWPSSPSGARRTRSRGSPRQLGGRGRSAIAEARRRAIEADARERPLRRCARARAAPDERVTTARVRGSPMATCATSTRSARRSGAELAADPPVCRARRGRGGRRAVRGDEGTRGRVRRRRVRDTPISEETVMGHRRSAPRSSAAGPCVEIMFVDFVTLAMDQLVNHAAKLHYMSGGQLARAADDPRAAAARSAAMGAHHSQSLEAWFAHVPGLKVVAPSTPADALALLARRDPRRQPGALPRAPRPVLEPRDEVDRRPRASPRRARAAPPSGAPAPTSRSSPGRDGVDAALEAAERARRSTASTPR